MLLQKGYQSIVRRMGSALDHLDHQEEISQIFHGRFSCPQQSINCHESIINGRFHCVDRLGLLASLLAIRMIKNYCSFYYTSMYKIFLENCSLPNTKNVTNNNSDSKDCQSIFLTHFKIT